MIEQHFALVSLVSGVVIKAPIFTVGCRNYRSKVGIDRDVRANHFDHLNGNIHLGCRPDFLLSGIVNHVGFSRFRRKQGDAEAQQGDNSRELAPERPGHAPPLS